MSKTLEELKTYVGLMMLDLGGNWAYEYKDRIKYVNRYLDEIFYHPDATDEDKSFALSDARIGISELENGGYDGRVYRDCAKYYGYSSKEGLTDEVIKELSYDMTHYPDDHLQMHFKKLDCNLSLL